MTNTEAAAILHKILQGNTDYNLAVRMGIEALEQQEIVRCKDCVFHTHDDVYESDWCDRQDDFFAVDLDDFCSWGVRREEDG